jgi:hypothetical protein
MIPTQVTYTRKKELGPMESEEISVTVEINQNPQMVPGLDGSGGAVPVETADAALRLAKKFVVSKLETGGDPHVDRARRIIEDPDEYTHREVMQARKVIEALPPVDNTPIL